MDTTHGKAPLPPFPPPTHPFNSFFPTLSAMRSSSEGTAILFSQSPLCPPLDEIAEGCPDSLAMANPRKRPRSRGSTDSIQSTATTAQAKLEDSFAETSEAYAAQWLATSGMPDGLSRSQDPSREMIPAAHHQMTTEDLLLASQLQAGSRDYMEGPVVGGPMHSASFHHHSQSVSRQSMSAESFTGNGSFADDSQMLDRDGNEDGESFGAGGAAPKPMSRTSANNELEMRQLFTANQHRNLQDVAEELHGNERGPNSERTRQVFAMLWYAAFSLVTQSLQIRSQAPRHP